ncbi:MAG: WhiB family transcriptional regulator [Actinomycetota bacterium]|nr:WhiB family transcriptional regulator [Actinomycetota bacterium]
MRADPRPLPSAELRRAGTTVIDGPSAYACADDPDRWTTTPDDGAKALCRACPRRWLCAQEACRTPGAEGVWAGVLIPGEGRGRRFALKQLGSLAARHGFPAHQEPTP